jgi:sugar lactone lactonase YvrE
LDQPYGVAVDGAGNVYIADSGDNEIKRWTPAGNNATVLVSSGLSNPRAVAVDANDNVYIANTGGNSIQEWTAINNTVNTLVSSNATTPLYQPSGVAVDNAGNVYIADTGNNAVKEWTVAGKSVTNLVSGLAGPAGVAVDGAGNVYIADTGNDEIKKWTAANNSLSNLVSGLSGPAGVAVDASGNVYIADTGHGAIKMWSAASNNVIALASGLAGPAGVAVDRTGNVYIADTGNNAVEELPYAFVVPAAVFAGDAAGSATLPEVLPATANLAAPFAPASSDANWLTINLPVTNGSVSFSFTTNAGPSRAANITLLGQTISVTQGAVGPSPSLTGAQVTGNGVFQFGFINNPNASFTVLSSTNLSLPLSQWTVAGPATMTAPGVFRFTATATNTAPTFYVVRSP